MQKDLFIKLLLIFIAALIVRFLYFPNNVYFGYDQARDSYSSLELLKGHLKLIGPPSSVDGRIFHGPLIYYIYAPIYYISQLNPEAVSFVFRIINALGIFLVFIIGLFLFNKNIGLISAFLFAVSYEQTQYSLFLSHPSLAVISVLIYYLGLALTIFKKNEKGLLLAAAGFGLSIQFHYVNLFLIIGLIFYLIIYSKQIFSFNKRVYLLSLSVFLLTILSFIIAEIKFDFRSTEALLETFANLVSNKTQAASFTGLDYIFGRFIHDNFVSWNNISIFLFFLILSIIFVLLAIKKGLHSKLVFLVIWFINGLIAYILSGSSSYYYNPATSVSLILFVSYVIFLIWKGRSIIGLATIILVAFSNLSLILNLNQKGPNSDIIIQPEMLTIYEKQTLDFCYQKAQGERFSVNALTIPLFINTTWSYLFQWYGLQNYHYLPTWGGKLAEGFFNSLPYEPKHSQLPEKQCLIIEPTIGLSEHDKNNFLKEEGYFSEVVEEKRFGTISVQFRRKI